MENPNTTSKPWKVEYAKSSRSSCKTCKQPIGKGSLRIAKIVSARQFEGVMPIWNHVDCILKYPGQFRTIDDVEGLDILESEDQKKIKKYFESLSEGSAPTNAYKLVEGIDESAIEKSKSSRATCKSCNQKIAKGEIRISTMADPENPWFRGTVAVWRHAKCFLEIGWWTSPIEKMSGWESLSPEDKHSVQSLAEQYIQDGCRIDTKQEAEEKLETSPQGSKMAEDLKHGNEGSDEGIGKKRKAKKSGTKSDENKKGGSSLNKKANKLDEGMGRESPQSSKNLEMQTKVLLPNNDKFTSNLLHCKQRCAGHSGSFQFFGAHSMNVGWLLVFIQLQRSFYERISQPLLMSHPYLSAHFGRRGFLQVSSCNFPF